MLVKNSIWEGINHSSHYAAEIIYCFDLDPDVVVCKLIDHNNAAGMIRVESGNGVIAAADSVPVIYTMIYLVRK